MSKTLSIGRSEDNDIVLAHLQLSNHHAQLTLLDGETGRYRIRDLDSANGVFKNGERVSEAEFGPRDSVSLANIKLTASLYQAHFRPPALDISSIDVPADGAATGGRGARRRSRPLRLLAFLAGGGLLALLIYLLEQRYGEQMGFTLEVTTTARTLGYVLVAWALLWAGMSLLSTLRRIGYERRQQDLDLALWEQRLQAARRPRAVSEDAVGAWNGFRKFEIARKVQEGGGICSFYLTPHDRKALPAFQPGQYLTFQLHIPGHQQSVIRCYSLSDDPFQKDHYRVTIKKLPAPRNTPDAPPGLSSSYFHEQLDIGDIVDVKAPAGHFYLDLEKETSLVLIGGGVGITPVLSMLNAIAAGGSRRETWFFYGVRNGAEHIMAEHLRQVAKEHLNVELHICYSDPQQDEVQGRHYDHAERVSVELFKRLLPSNNYDFYVCGPPPMMDSITAGLEDWGVPRGHIHFEAFGPASAKRVTHAEGSAKPPAGQFEVRFEKSGKSCQWSEESGSLLDLAEANGVAMNFGCRAGNCGTCAVALREGGVEYINEPGAAVEDGTCLACIARPAGKLVVDA